VADIDEAAEDALPLDEIFEETKNMIAKLRTDPGDPAVAILEVLSLLRDTQLAMLVFAEEIQDQLDPPIEIQQTDAQEVCELLSALGALSKDPHVQQQVREKIELLTPPTEPEEAN
jgi:hypothetical protein